MDTMATTTTTTTIAITDKENIPHLPSHHAHALSSAARTRLSIYLDTENDISAHSAAAVSVKNSLQHKTAPYQKKLGGLGVKKRMPLGELSLQEVEARSSPGRMIEIESYLVNNPSRPHRVNELAGRKERSALPGMEPRLPSSLLGARPALAARKVGGSVMRGMR
ncbi:hypothetical protein SAICODRAFT_66075 [Saitoella complicata NRRL Y-17804]|uniref:uncharacterized protein n=1 Tax=Saitoella complicata (strain BCRC 22490 / CBS 7301 / JCM 7358 / NBRC 10748 / NRRL Y-17804) TaxID=698492 RepID=UPI000867C533|nr:uncharacterized protein SAICODRAFT_66075 [Saitoella complicata NRRL Y-17804]ODQ52448.1 hypothetical protein SAICODRAFT_66075 [Saitoella complicata NRRL Y-17804]